MRLGSDEFKHDYGVKHAYVAGAMVYGIASKELVVAMGKSGLLAYFGTGGLSIEEIEENLQGIQQQLSNGQPYGMNLLNGTSDMDIVKLYLRYGVSNIEAAAYVKISPAIVKYRLHGLRSDVKGRPIVTNRIMAKLSRPEVAAQFLSPAPEGIVERLLAQNEITAAEAKLSRYVPIADDICVEADSGGHTDQGVAYSLIPALLKLRDKYMTAYKYSKRVRVGAAGGIGTPEAVAAAFIMGVDFVLTGSINQCTVEAGTSDLVKEMLQGINIQDTDYAPAGDMFEIGAKVQVLKKGVYFPARANRLYELYRSHESLADIDSKIQSLIQEKYFKRSFDTIFEEIRQYRPASVIAQLEKNPKQKMAAIFKWYFYYTNQLALDGIRAQKTDFQIHCGPALGAFNQWVNGTSLESWKNRHVNDIAEKILDEAAVRIESFYKSLH